MISVKINEFPGETASLEDIWAGLTGMIEQRMLKLKKRSFTVSDAIPSHVKNLIAFAREVRSRRVLCCFH